MKYRKAVFGKGKKAKIKHSILCNGYEKGSIKNVALSYKITSMQCFWVKSLFEDDFRNWKVMLLFLMGKHSKQY